MADSTFALSLLLRPFAVLVFMAVIVWPIKWVLGKLIPEGRVKQFLWRRLN
jgi:hypothetical protein